MKTKNVIVLPYTRQLQADFEAIKSELTCALGDHAVAIEHVGSTAVEGMAAKPIIDIDVVIADYSVFEKVAARLDIIGYTHEGDLGIKEREAFSYTGKLHLQPHHLYVCPQNSRELHRHIAFRNFLRSDPNAVLRYSLVKEAGAKLYGQDIDSYIAYKSACIEELYKQCGLE